jgi:uncharacterized protein
LIDILHPVKVYSNLAISGKHSRDILIDVYVPENSTPGPVVIFSHGFKGFKDWGPFDKIARLFSGAGFIFVKFNFAFNGTTAEEPLDFSDLDAFGNNNFTRELDDLERVIDWVSAEKRLFTADLNKISLLGHSRGGGITILKAAEDKRIASLATWAAVADFSRFITGQDIQEWKKTGVHFIENTRTGQMMPLYLQLYNDFMENQERLQIKTAVSKLRKPLLLVHGTEDDTVALSHAIELHGQNPAISRLVTIEGGDHTFGAVHPFTLEALPPLFQYVVRETIHFFQS